MLCVTLITPAALVPSRPLPAAHLHARAPWVRCSPSHMGGVPLEQLRPSPLLQPREVISSTLAALHESNWDTPTPYFGVEVAFSFLAPTHQAKRMGEKAAGFASHLVRLPHAEMLWNEFRFEGETILVQSDEGMEEAYQMCSLRSGPEEEWISSRWKLVKVNPNDESSSQKQWMIEAVFANEPVIPPRLALVPAMPH